MQDGRDHPGAVDEQTSARAELVKRLEDRRAALRLAKTQLAARTGLSRGTVQAAFSTRGPLPTSDTVVALATALRLPAEGLLDLRRIAAVPSVVLSDDGPSTAPVEARPIAAPDAWKAARVLELLPPGTPWLKTVRNPMILPLHYELVTTRFDEACRALRDEQDENGDFLDPDLHAVFEAMVKALDALEELMDGMYGPDERGPWRDVTDHPLQREQEITALVEARTLFGARYRALLNLLNARGLLPPSRKSRGGSSEDASEPDQVKDHAEPESEVERALKFQREKLRQLAVSTPLLSEPEFFDPTAPVSDADPMPALLQELRELPDGAGLIGQLARDPWPSPKSFVSWLLLQGPLDDEAQAQRLLSAAAYRPLREVRDIAVLLAEGEPDLVRYHLLYVFGAVRKEHDLVKLSRMLQDVPVGVWNGVDVVAAFCAGYAATRRPVQVAAFIHVAADCDQRLRDALTMAGACHGSPDDVAELVRALASGPDPGLVGIVMEQAAREEEPGWVELVIEELERWGSHGEAAYIRSRRAGLRAEEALERARPLPWTMNWLARHQPPVDPGGD